jgi:SAM-dependent methyltransferase
MFGDFSKYNKHPIFNMDDYSALNRLAYERTAEEYFRNTPLYSKSNQAVISNFVTFLEKKYPENKNISILDVGVGSGLDLSIFEKLGYLTYGIDISEKMIKFAKTNSQKTTFYCGDFLEFPFDQKFSGIYAQAFIHLFPKERVYDILEKMHSLLEPEGLIHFSTTVHEIPSEGFEEKTDYRASVKRYRKRWTLIELNEFIEGLTFLENIHQYQIVDPKGKTWVNTIAGRKV